MPGVTTEKVDTKNDVDFRSLVVSRLGRNIFSSFDEATRRFNTTIEAGYSHLNKNNIDAPPQPRGEHIGIVSFRMKVGARSSAQKTPTPAMALASHVHADLSHRHLGHMNPRSMEVLRKKDGSGVDLTDTLSDGDIRHVNKSRQKAHQAHGVDLH